MCTKNEFFSTEMSRGHTLKVGTAREGMALIWPAATMTNAAGDSERPDLNKHAHEHHWQRPDGSVYVVDSSD